MLRQLASRAPNDGSFREALQSEACVSAFLELLSALVDEANSILIADSATLADSGSWPFWRRVLRWCSNRPFLWIFPLRAGGEGEIEEMQRALNGRIRHPSARP
jgi:hypothetical protein